MNAPPPDAGSAEELHATNIKRGLAIAVGFSIVSMAAVLFFTVDKRTFLLLDKVKPSYTLLILLCMFISWYGEGLSLKFLAEALGKKASGWSMTRVFLAGNFVGLVTPFGSGGVPAQIYMLTREGLTAGEAAVVGSTRAVLSAWFFGILGPMIFLFFSPTMPSGFSLQRVYGGIFGLLLILSIAVIYFVVDPDSGKSFVLWFFRHRTLSRLLGRERAQRLADSVSRRLDELHDDLTALKKRPLKVLAAMLAIIVSWVFLLIVAPLTMLGLGWHGDYLDLFFRSFLVLLLSPVSPTPGNSGTAELAFSAFLISIVPKELIGLAVVVWRFFTYYVSLIAGGPFFLHAMGRKEERAAPGGEAQS